MKKPTWKRIAAGLLQHLLAAALMAAAAEIMLNSYIAVESIDGTKVYQVIVGEAGEEFEESEIYSNLFRNAVSDVTQLVVIRERLETNEVFDSAKHIDITEFAGELGTDRDCGVTAVYELDNLIKWGKRGVEYTERTMSMSDFVNYFGFCLYPENFTLDEYGQLIFDQFYKVTEEEPDSWDTDGTDASGGEDGQEVPREPEFPEGKTEEQLKSVQERMSSYSRPQLEDMVFAYLMGKDLDQVRLSREDDGSLAVTFPLLICRYDTVDDERQLVQYADNWVDYMRLQENLTAVIESLTRDYERYQICNPAYAEGSSNVKYMVRMTTEDGVRNYTNVPSLKQMEDEYITDYFTELRSHLIYYPDSLMFMGNTSMSEEELYDRISVYENAYPDNTHIWIGVDALYTVEGDAFYNAHEIYEKILPNLSRMLLLIAFLSLSWIGIAIHMSVTAGTAVGEDGNKVRYLNGFDHMWTEVFLLFGGLLIYIGIWGYRLLTEVAQTAGVLPVQMLGLQLSRLYHYSVFGLYGVYVSASFCLIWYSLIRRIKSFRLWKDSFLYWLIQKVKHAVHFIFRFKNSVISILLPYNVYVLVNLAMLVVVYLLRERRVLAGALAAVLVILDGGIGVFLFKRNAEQKEIVEGINRIRSGEVDFKLDTDRLHGSSRELADAVNNIGEGIRAAVRTSMKDEQLKTDLITNVSHDIKTPLTSIINYVDLLKRLKIEEEPAKGYIQILDAKAQRLKQLTDDLVEASKISSGNIELDREKLNLTELIHQSIGEFSEKLEEKKLDVIFSDGGSPACIYADSRRMWRIVENLFNNICKYALEGTRVYIDIVRWDGKVEISFKNISRQQMNIRPEELTERFIRGDLSRSTEGSGLGLSIAKSLISVQGGVFDLKLDGDLFKVVMTFPEYREDGA